MSQANVNVGTAPGAGNGDNLYNAFTKVNTNFTELYSTITSHGVTYANITPSVDSSGLGSGLTVNITKYANLYGVSVNLPGTGYAVNDTVRIWGNVVGGTYTTNDLVVSVSTVGLVATGNVTAVAFTGTPSSPVLTVAGRTGGVVLTTNDIVGLASQYSPNVSIQNAVDGKIASNIANLIGTAPGILDTLGEIADAINDDADVYTTLVSTITTANTNVVGYVDSSVSTANVNLKGYTDNLVTTANVNLKGYVDAANVNVVGYVDAANVNVVGYVDGQITNMVSNAASQSGELASLLANAAVQAGELTSLVANAASQNDQINTANVNLKGYTDNLVTNANVNVVGYVDSAVSTANVNLKGYTDGQFTTGNTNVVGYVDNAVSTANVNVVGYVDGEITTTTSAITTGNTNVVGYVDGEVVTLNSSITTANTNVVGYVDGEVTTLNSAITTANVNVVGYVDSAVSTANVNLKGYTDGQFTTGNTNVVGYVDNAVSTANVNLKGYVDSEISDTVSATGSSIADANVNLKGYTDNLVTTANVNVVGYVDAQTYDNTDVAAYTGNIQAKVNGYDIGYKIIPQVAAGNVTIALADSGKHYYSTDANPTTLTIPLNSSVAFDTGTAISIVNQGTGNISVALTGGVSMYLAGASSSGGRTITTYGTATLMKVATDTWFINGTGVV